MWSDEPYTDLYIYLYILYIYLSCCCAAAAAAACGSAKRQNVSKMCEKLQKENTVRRARKMGEIGKLAMESQSSNANTATFRLRQAGSGSGSGSEVRIAGQALALY